MPAPLATFADLVAPLSAAQFGDLLAAREPRHFPGDMDRAARYAALLDWDALVAGMRDGAYPERSTRIYRDRAKVPKMFLRGATVDRAELIDRLVAADSSIVLNSAEKFVPAIGALCSAVASETRDHVSAVAIATSGHGGAFETHWDEYDLVVLQVDGAKSWSIWGDPAFYPVKEMDRGTPPEGKPPVLEVTLQPGDWLFVPAGCWHRCDTPDARSLHLSVMLYPFNALRAARVLMREMIDNPDDRAPMRFDMAEADTVEAALRKRLIARIEATPLAELIRIHQSTGAAPAGDADTEA